MNILLADDDHDILSTIADHMELHGAQVDCAMNGRQAVQLNEEHDYDVIVLDVMMHDGDGISACRELRRRGCTSPILFLTARDSLNDKVDGFEAGCDDYLVKPFFLKELRYRACALAKRISKQRVRQLKFAELTIDLDRKLIEREGIRLLVNAVQFRMLVFFLQQTPKVISRAQLENHLWGDHVPDSDVLKSHIYQLRKIVDKPFSYPMLETVRGMGYRLRSNSQSD